MLLSMTGHGQGSSRTDVFSIDVEIRTVNNRFLKLVSRLSDWAIPVEADLESLVRDSLKRGSVTLSVRVVSTAPGSVSRVNQSVLGSYVNEAKIASKASGIPLEIDWGNFLSLPGVLDAPLCEDNAELNQEIKRVCKMAIGDLQGMRAREGKAMEVKFTEYLTEIHALRQSIASRAPRVVAEYQAKLEQRVRAAIESRGLEWEESEFLREITLFCDRTDISEELTRLESHLTQFAKTMASEESQGRRLDFLLQELGRETNTIGSKANDAEISNCVVSIKTILEQIRELVQNVE